MCLPYLKDKAESFSDTIVRNTPNGLIVLNEKLEVQQINRAALKILNLRLASDILGDQVVRIMEPGDFIEVLSKGTPIHNKRVYLAEYEKYVEETIVYDNEYRLIICILSDVTEEEKFELKVTDKGEFAGLAFKLMSDPYVGQLTFVRIYSGTLTSGQSVMNTNKHRRERVGRLLRMHANKREDVTEAHAGEIVAVLGLKSTVTGDTLCDEGLDVVLESMTFPEPVITMSIEPDTQDDVNKLGLALQKLAAEDPSFKVTTDKETGQTVIGGMGELHLDIIASRLKREFNVNAKVGRPQVAYRETITREGNCECMYKRQSGGRGQYGHVKMVMRPNEPGTGVTFESKIVGGVVPREYWAAVEKGVRSAAETGVLAGYPVVDVHVELVDGSYHEVDSSEMAVQVAGSMAFKDGCKKCGAQLLEPVFDVEVITPEEYTGDVIGDLNSRRGRIQDLEPRKGVQAIRAAVPLSEMFGYSTVLRSATQGRASYTMQFKCYEPLPAALSEGLIEKFGAKSNS